MMRAGLLAAVCLIIPVLAKAEAPERVLALGGSVTEIIHALGQEDRLVARDSSSTYPQAALALPDVGYLRALAPEGVLSVAPDLILAEPDAGPPEAVAALRAASVPFVLVPPARDAAGVQARIEAVAAALGVPEAGAALAAEVGAEIAAATALRPADAPKKRAIFVLSAEGGRLMAAGQGTAADAILGLAGLQNAMEGFQGYKPVSDEAVIAAAPEVVVMMDRAGQAAPDTAALFVLPALAGSPAAAEAALVRLDGLFLLGFGPRTGQAIVALQRAAYGG